MSWGSEQDQVAPPEMAAAIGESALCGWVILAAFSFEFCKGYISFMLRALLWDRVDR